MAVIVPSTVGSGDARQPEVAGGIGFSNDFLKVRCISCDCEPYHLQPNGVLVPYLPLYFVQLAL